MTEGRDWTRSQFEVCPDCGFDPGEVADRRLGRALTDAGASWGRTLARVDPGLLRVRPEPSTWSAIEYAGHVRDLLVVFEARVRRTLVEDDPELGWWDHEAAVVDDRYVDDVPVLVAEAIADNVRVFARTISLLGPGDTARRATRRSGETFTIGGMSRFVLHEMVHHRLDAERGLDSLA